MPESAPALIDRLRAVKDFTPSHQPVAGEVLELVGVLIAYLEHGDALLEAAERDRQAREAGEPSNEVNELLSPSPEPEQPAPSASDQAAELAALRQQVQTLLAQQQRTQPDVTPEPGGEEKGEDKG